MYKAELYATSESGGRRRAERRDDGEPGRCRAGPGHAGPDLDRRKHDPDFLVGGGGRCLMMFGSDVTLPVFSLLMLDSVENSDSAI